MNRRDLLRGLAGFGGAFACSGMPLGVSLWLRPDKAPLPEGVPTTLTLSGTMSTVYTGTIPPTITFSGVYGGVPPEPGTWTQTGPPDPSATTSWTKTWPAPGGTQTVTMWETWSFSYTPPATNNVTISVEGGSWSRTVVRTPSWFTASATQTRTLSYTSTTPVSPPKEPLQAIIGDDEDACIIRELDDGDFDACNPAWRGAGVPVLQLACGARQGAP